MRKLNYQVDGEHSTVREVAEQFLREASLQSLVGNQQIVGKGPFRIDPLGRADESRTASQTRNVLDAELVAGFRPDRFSFSQRADPVGGPGSRSFGLLVERRCISIRRSMP